MPLTHKLEMDGAALVTLKAAARRGLIKGGDLILAASDVLAPREDDPRHGVHMTETGFVSLEADSDEGDRVRIGYEAYWSIWQHENLTWKHTHGEAKFLEMSLLQYGPAALELVAAAMREELGE